MSKYDPLQRYLEGIQPSVLKTSLTFGEIEKILGFTLPPSAYNHREWWSNPSTPTQHPYAQSWLAAGWKVDSVDYHEKRVDFRRAIINTSRSINNRKVGPLSTDLFSKEHNEQKPRTNIGNEGMQTILDLGFERVGEWFLEKSTLHYRIDKNEAERNILYAFVVQEEVYYIGKSTQTLSWRMNGYRNPGPTQITNLNNHARIKDILQAGISVQIFTLVSKENVLYHNFPINIAAGLEDNLIARINPPWNDRK